jgi:hypothetical protein
MLTACPPAYAQSDDAPDVEDRWALQFQITDNVTLGDFQGALISAKRQCSARHAFRFGVNLGASVTRIDEDRDALPDSERDQNRQSINATAQWIRYPVHEGAIRAYWGLGPTIGFSRRGGDSDELGLNGGAISALGVEWFVHSRLSLSAEYRAGLSYRYFRRDQGLEETTTRHQVSLGSRSVLFGVSVYF